MYRDRVELVSNPTEFPDTADSSSGVLEVQEPIVNASIIVPEGTLEIEQLGFMNNESWEQSILETLWTCVLHVGLKASTITTWTAHRQTRVCF